MTSTLRDMTTLIKAVGTGKLLSKSSQRASRSRICRRACRVRRPDRLRTRGRRRQWVGVAEPGLQRIRGDRRVPAVAEDLDRDRQHARPERREGHEHRDRHLQGARRVPGPY